MKRALRALRKAVAEGLLVILPVAFTAYVAHAVFALVYRLFGFGLLFIPRAAHSLPWARPVATAATAVVTALLIVSIGLVVRTVAGHRLGRLAEAAIASVPLTRSLFQAFRQLLHLLFLKPAPDQARVVLVRFPHRRSYAVGFVTGDASQRLSGDGGGRHVRVFVPGTPNPSTGFLLLVPRRDLIRTRLSTEQALRLVVSGGILQD